MPSSVFFFTGQINEGTSTLMHSEGRKRDSSTNTGKRGGSRNKFDKIRTPGKRKLQATIAKSRSPTRHHSFLCVCECKGGQRKWYTSSAKSVVKMVYIRVHCSPALSQLGEISSWINRRQPVHTSVATQTTTSAPNFDRNSPTPPDTQFHARTLSLSLSHPGARVHFA